MDFQGARAIEAVGQFGKDEDVGEIVYWLGLGIVRPSGCIVGFRVVQVWAQARVALGKGKVGDRLRPHPKIKPHSKKF